MPQDTDHTNNSNTHQPDHHSEHMQHPDIPTHHHDMHDHGGHMHDHTAHHAHMIADFRRRFWVSILLTIPILLLSPMIQSFLHLGPSLQFTGDSYVLFILATAVFFYGGWPFLKGLVDELRAKSPGMMTLIAVAITVAWVYSSAVVFGLQGRLFYWELATLIDIMLLGHWIEMKSVMGASKALEELAKLMPSEAHRLTPDGRTEDIPLASLNKGDRVLVKPGERIPADGHVTDGSSSVNEAMITGESTPVTKQSGAQVIGGSINGEGSLTVEVQKTGSESFLSQVVEMVRAAQAGKSKTQTLADKAAFWLTIIALSAGVITLVVWLALVHKDFQFALSRTVTVMVITCPHALGLAIPLVVAVSTALSASHGLLIRNRNGFESARKIQAVIFDKTGTLTKGEFGVTDTVLFADDLNEKELLKYMASVEHNSEHPIAKGIFNSSSDVYDVKNFTSLTGQGAQGMVNGKQVKVVSPGYLDQNNMTFDRDRVAPLSAQGKTVVFAIIDNQVKGAVALADIIRDESKEAVAKLKEMNITPMMLTGDNKQVAAWVAEQLGLEEYFAEVLPKDKADKVKEVQSRGIVVAMTGDGVNDAPALAQADVGIAIGAGTDVAVETADVILVKSNPMDVVAVIELSRATYRKMVQNLIWATGYNAIAIPLAAGVLYSWGIVLGPAVGAALMSLSTVIVAVNARFLRMPQTSRY